MTDNGHVFVVRGRLENLDSDVIVVPTDRKFSLREQWRKALGAQDGVGIGTEWAAAVHTIRPPDWQGAGRGRAVPALGFEPPAPVWFVDAADRETDALEDEARAMLKRARAVLEDVADASVKPRDRPRPLVALPTIGVSGGGFDAVRGVVVDGLLSVCTDVAQRRGIDIVIVAFAAADYSAFQDRRREAGVSRGLSPEVAATAKELGSRAREGSLALFLGAGVSMSAGLPSWKELIKELAGESEESVLSAGNELDQAELLSRRLGDDLGERVVEIVGRTERYGLNHALLAALGCTESVTTNYDRLYERAVRDAGRPVVSVLPLDEVDPRAPWVLKMHGDVSDSLSIVLSRSDFVGYDSRFRPLGAVVQSLLLIKHLLVVGASMTDDNFLRLAHEVVAFRERHRPKDSPARELGTVVTMKPDVVKTELWKDRFRVTTAASDVDASDAEQARRLAVFLDAVAMYASGVDHLANPRYAYLLANRVDDLAIADLARTLAGRIQARGDAGPWEAVRSALEQTGAG